MKKTKKIFLILLIFVCFLAVGCEKPVSDPTTDPIVNPVYDPKTPVNPDAPTEVDPPAENDNEVVLPNLLNKSREEMAPILDSLGVCYEFAFVSDHVDEEYMNKFVRYSGGYVAGDKISKDKFVYVYTTVLPLTFTNHDQVKIDFEYEGKSFVNDGVGEVTLARNIDGDTAHFYDITGEYIKVRFLCINTPESTKEHDPWGKAASKYTASILNNAKEIVLECEPSNIKDVYGRYLAYVWVDGKLLNLMLVEEAYTYTSPSGSKYQKYFTEAGLMAKATGRRFFGETDPDYDYEAGDFR